MAAKEQVFTPTFSHPQALNERTMRRVGELLDMEIRNPVDMVRISRRGIPAIAVQRLIQTGFTKQELAWIIPRTTLNRRKGSSLTPEESSRWLRVAKLQAMAVEVLGSGEKASKWLHKPRKAFDGMSAMEVMQTEAGGQLVEETLGQLDSGFFA